MEQDIVFRHELPAQLRWSDVDQFGHVNNNVYFALYDMCKTRYFLDVAGEDIFQRMAIVVANINANFLMMIPYIMTLLVIVISARRSLPPAGMGKHHDD